MFNASVVFPTRLLAFLAIELCLAVAKQHNVTLCSERTKKTLAAIAAVYIYYSAIVYEPRIIGFIRINFFQLTGMENVCFFVVIASYNMLAVIKMKRMKAARRRVDVFSMIRSSAEAVATCSTSTLTSNPTTTTQVTVSPTPSRANGNAVAPSAIKLTKAVQAKRSTLLLFVVTSIFVVCWLLFFLKNYGLPMTCEARVHD